LQSSILIFYAGYISEGSPTEERFSSSNVSSCPATSSVSEDVVTSLTSATRLSVSAKLTSCSVISLSEEKEASSTFSVDTVSSRETAFSSSSGI